MMVVIVLMGVVAGLAFPRFKSLFEVDLKSSMRRLAGGIKFCFNEAVIRQATIRLNFDLDSGTYRHSVLLTTPDTTVGEFIDVPSAIQKAEILPRGVRFLDILTPRSPEKIAEGDTYVLFYSTGFAEKAVIHIGDERGRVYTLLVKPLTGGVKIFEGYVDFAELHQTETPFGSSQSPFGQ